MDSMNRREFLRLAGAAALATQIPSLIGCGKSARSIKSSALLQEVQHLQRSLSVFPASPVAVAWDPNVDSYPRLRDPQEWFRERSNVYPLVEKAMMLLNKEQ